MGNKEQIHTRVDPDMKNQISEYQGDRDVTQSEAVRRLLQRGLAEEGYPVSAADGGTIRDELGELDSNLGEVRNDLHRGRFGILLAVAYLAVAIRSPSTLAWNIGLIAAGLLLFIALYYAGMIGDPRVLGGSDS